MFRRGQKDTASDATGSNSTDNPRPVTASKSSKSVTWNNEIQQRPVFFRDRPSTSGADTIMNTMTSTSPKHPVQTHTASKSSSTSEDENESIPENSVKIKPREATKKLSTSYKNILAIPSASARVHSASSNSGNEFQEEHFQNLDLDPKYSNYLMEKFSKDVTKSAHQNLPDDTETENEESEESDESGTGSVASDFAVAPLDPTAHIAVPLRRGSANNNSRRAPSPPQEDQDNEEDSDTDTNCSLVSTDELNVVNLAMDATMEDMRALYPKAIMVKLSLLRDPAQKYRRDAMIRFADKFDAKRAYRQTKNRMLKGSKLSFSFDTNRNDDEEVESVVSGGESVLPTEKVDKQSLVRDWIRVQSNYFYQTKSKKHI